ncbi:hypothetical protein FRACYDRAFT_250025 [Fragilariopsis cylindrus CCMP1102]|uniref:Uncharacterized protein n=1 Tax=Fragilariopsis cylindrus CCMP1102 TaxID=635003 RepID=A0A1E7EQJ2_9STRA|nr:hypothetical protein FRACYDRAFT_250025 [Fragilariopsis cylindrus CCMP1102]|eukprot:OEU08238.1 hypothetical protein FRACYDRAFT_250025 [Fragilariopsis cylindrus CCMP1102]
MRLVIASTTAAILASTTTSSSTTEASVVASTTARHSIRGGGVIGNNSGGRKATTTTGTAATATDVARSVAIDVDTSKTTTLYHHHKNKNKNPVVQKLLNIKRKTIKTSSTDLEDNNDVSLLLDLGAITPKIKKRRRILSAAVANNANTNTNNRHGHHGRSLTNNSFDEEQLVEERADKVSIHSGAIRYPTNTNTDDDGSNSNVETNFMIPSLQYLCEQQPTGGAEKWTQTFFCDCENFDFELQKGVIDCNLERPYCSSTINSCGEEIEICYYDSIHLESIGVDDYLYRTCLTYTQPYQQQICTTFTSTSSASPSPQLQVTTNDDQTKQVTGIEYYEQQPAPTYSCDVTFNDKQCNSCEIEIREYELGDNIYYNRCFEINCGTNGNDNDNTIINTCDNGDSSPNSGVSTLKDKIIFGDDCTKCQPCGIGYYMKNLTGTGIFPIIGEYTCSGLELGSKIGFFDRELCEEIQSQTNIYCDCQPIFTTVVSNDNENENEPQSPSFAGGTVSSIEPEPEPKKEIEPETEAATETETIDPPLFVLPGDTINGSMCHVCGGSNNNNSAATADDLNSNSNSKVVYHVNNPNTILNLPDSSIPTTCLSLEAAGRLGFFSSDYCTDIVQPLVSNICGGCTATSTSNTSTSTSSIVNKNDGNNVSLRSSSLSAESTSTTPAVVAAINTTKTLLIAEEESKMSADDNVPPTTTTTTIQDNHPISCFVCDPDSELRLQNEIVPLDEDEGEDEGEDEDATSFEFPWTYTYEF